jgi:dimethyladenosine transferase 2, mitochondrial
LKASFVNIQTFPLIFRRWIPNCGPRLIVNPTPSIQSELMNPNIDLSTLPPLSQPCYQLSNQDFLEDCHIFTEFGDLTPNQVLSLFDRFRNWPEFHQSSFNASLESALMKLHSSPDDASESQGLVEEVDEEEEKK